MKRMAWAAALILSLVRAAPAQDAEVKESDHELEAGAAVSADSVIGRIRVTGGDTPVAHLKTSKRGRDAALVTFDVRSDAKKSLRVEAKLLRQPAPFQGYEVEIEIELIVPKTIDALSIRTASGSIDVLGVQARETALENTSGNVRVGGLKSDLTLNVISGSVHLVDLVGSRASISLTSGSVQGAAELKTLVVKGVSGNVSFDLTPPKEGEWSVTASLISGSVAFRLPKAAGGKFDCTTQTGAITCGFDLKGVTESAPHRMPRSLHATFGAAGGAGAVHLSTISGNLKVAPIE